MPIGVCSLLEITYPGRRKGVLGEGRIDPYGALRTDLGAGGEGGGELWSRGPLPAPKAPNNKRRAEKDGEINDCPTCGLPII